LPAEQERRARDRGLEFALNSANAGFRRFVVRVLREDPLIGGKRLADLAALDREARVSEIETRIPGILEDLFEDPSQLGIILSVCGLRQYCGGNENAKPANEDWFPTAHALRMQFPVARSTSARPCSFLFAWAFRSQTKCA
jgi:hypothetical protein